MREESGFLKSMECNKDEAISHGSCRVKIQGDGLLWSKEVC